MSVGTPIFDITHLTVTLQGVTILEDVSWKVEPHAYVGVVGPNGGGKTTFLKVLLGLIPPTKGEVRVFGERVAAASALKQRIGYVPQRLLDAARLFPATVRDVVELSARAAGKRGKALERAVQHAVERTDLSSLLSERLQTLSGGQMQRVSLARVLAQEPDVLILDEPTTFIDEQGQTELYAFLRELHKEGLTIVLVSHDLDIVREEAQSVLCLDRRADCHSFATRPAKKAAGIIHGHH